MPRDLANSNKFIHREYFAVAGGLWFHMEIDSKLGNIVKFKLLRNRNDENEIERS